MCFKPMGAAESPAERHLNSATWTLPGKSFLAEELLAGSS